LLDDLIEHPASRPCDITINDIEDHCAYRHGPLHNVWIRAKGV
jgi:hypothetical protein